MTSPNVPAPVAAQTSHEYPGFFVVLEGGDGAGKSSQIPELGAWLTAHGKEILATREPGGTRIGENIRPLILEHGQGEVDPRTEALLYAASRAAHVEQLILPALREGTVVLCDRFVDSSVAYQSAGRNLSAEEILSINAFATQGLVPDLTIVLDIDPLEAKNRRVSSRDSEDRLESESAAFHATVRQAFLDRADADPERYLVVDASLSRAAIQETITDSLRTLLHLPDDDGKAVRR